MQLPCLAVRDLHDSQAEASQDFEVGAGVAAHVGHASDEEHRHADATLHQRAGDDEAVAAVVAAAAEHRDLALEKVAVHRFHRGHDLTAGVLHQHERGNANLLESSADRLHASEPSSVRAWRRKDTHGPGAPRRPPI